MRRGDHLGTVGAEPGAGNRVPMPFESDEGRLCAAHIPQARRLFGARNGLGSRLLLQTSNSFDLRRGSVRRGLVRGCLDLYQSWSFFRASRLGRLLLLALLAHAIRLGRVAAPACFQDGK
jgi:hypothetical protein